MRAPRMLRRQMIAKVFGAIAIVVGAIIAVQAVVDARREARTLRRETRSSAGRIAHLVVGAVEHAMLQGLGIEVERLIGRMKDRLPGAEVAIYDARGIEVFAPEPAPPPPSEIPDTVRAVLEDGRRRVAESGRIVRPIPAEDRCRRCHDDGHELRGVLALELSPAKCASGREDAFVRLVTSGFTHIMTARRAWLLDDYFRELASAARSLEEATVFDSAGDVAFGENRADVPTPDVKSMAAPGMKRQRMHKEDGAVEMVPLPMQDRCVACHSYDAGPVRGVLTLSLSAADRSRCDPEELEGIIDISLRYIMLSELGRRIADFLDSAAETAAVEELTLYDHAGRVYWTTDHPEPPPAIADVLETGEIASAFEGSGADERVRVIEPLENREGCTRCHGDGMPLRGAVAVTLSTASASELEGEIVRARVGFAVLTLAGLLAALWLLLRRLVVNPVRDLGRVAEEIGRGRLEVFAARADPDGDEISRLGDRFNAMIAGLRAKTQLERFVSRGAAAAAEDAGASGIRRAGERRDVAVLFSDVRGFTSYAESVPPEEVVSMLNRLLKIQTDLVESHGGDIDKFVGDELMAVFDGPDAAARAARCGLALAEAVGSSNDRSVGVGVAAGEVVYGAIGAESRLDFTVIGDVVNTGARLCSAAAPGEVLVTETVVRRGEGSPDITFEPRPDLTAKGKRAPIATYAVAPAPHDLSR